MYSKIIRPSKQGKIVYNNLGSCKNTVKYLGHEAKENNRDYSFFDFENQDIDADHVNQAIDANSKGLLKNQEKFYSLVISPSQQELTHIENSDEKLKSFTRTVMENYAANFNLKDGKKLLANDLVWFATIHENRKVKMPTVDQNRGEKKPGLNKHIHILVSARDQNRQYRLNPKGWRSRFSLKDWQLANGKSFQKNFNYDHPTISEKLTSGPPAERIAQFQNRIRDRVSFLNEYFLGKNKLETQKVIEIAKDQSYEKGFFFKMHHLTERYKHGKFVYNPYQMLEKGKDESLKFPERSTSAFIKNFYQMDINQGDQENDTLDLKKRKKTRQLEIS